jgi:hypothetical protein
LLGGNVQRFAAGFTRQPTVQVCWRRRNGTSDPHDRHTAFCPALSYINRLTQEGRNLLPFFQRRWRGFGFRRFFLEAISFNHLFANQSASVPVLPLRIRASLALKQFLSSSQLRILSVPDL